MCHWHAWLQCTEPCVLDRLLVLSVKKRYRLTGDTTDEVLRPGLGHGRHGGYQQAPPCSEDPRPGVVDWLSLASFVFGVVFVLVLLIVNCGV